MRITLIKKIKADGSACRKCADVEKRLRDAVLFDRIDRVVIADERQPESEGMQLARNHNVEVAPFFIVEDDDGAVRIFTVYFRFLKEVLRAGTDESEEMADIMDRSSHLDLL